MLTYIYTRGYTIVIRMLPVDMIFTMSSDCGGPAGRQEDDDKIMHVEDAKASGPFLGHQKWLGMDGAWNLTTRCLVGFYGI